MSSLSPVAVLPACLDRLGDSKDAVREASEEVMLKLMLTSSPQVNQSRLIVSLFTALNGCLIMTKTLCIVCNEKKIKELEEIQLHQSLESSHNMCGSLCGFVVIYLEFLWLCSGQIFSFFVVCGFCTTPIVIL